MLIEAEIKSSLMLIQVKAALDVCEGLLRLQEIYQSIQPGRKSILIEMVRRVNNSTEALDFLRHLESIDRFTHFT